MSEIDIAGATDALAAELPESYEDGGSVVDSDNTPVGDNPDVESFTGFDPNNLPEDLQAVYKSMQADYTRKTQDLAKQREEYKNTQTSEDDNDVVMARKFLERE